MTAKGRSQEVGDAQAVQIVQARRGEIAHQRHDRRMQAMARMGEGCSRPRQRGRRHRHEADVETPQRHGGAAKHGMGIVSIEVDQHIVTVQMQAAAGMLPQYGLSPVQRTTCLQYSTIEALSHEVLRYDDSTDGMMQNEAGPHNTYKQQKAPKHKELPDRAKAQPALRNRPPDCATVQRRETPRRTGKLATPGSENFYAAHSGGAILFAHE